MFNFVIFMSYLFLCCLDGQGDERYSTLFGTCTWYCTMLEPTVFATVAGRLAVVSVECQYFFCNLSGTTSTGGTDGAVLVQGVALVLLVPVLLYQRQRVKYTLSYRISIPSANHATCAMLVFVQVVAY